MVNARLRTRSITAGLTASARAANCPNGELARRGRCTIASVITPAAWSGVSAGNLSYILVGLIIGVRTSAICTVVNLMSSPTTSACSASHRLSSAALLAM